MRKWLLWFEESLDRTQNKTIELVELDKNWSNYYPI
jgi:hypothetical protein